MRFKELVGTSGLAAVAVAFAVAALPVTASARDNNSSDWQAKRFEQRGDNRAATIERRADNRADRVERQGDRRAAQIQRRTDNAPPRVERAGDRRAQQIDRRSEARADRIQWQGNRQADRVDRRSERQAEAIRDRRAASDRSRDYERNRSYSDRFRNGSYSDRDRNRSTENWRRDNDGWRDNNNRWRDNDRYRDARRDNYRDRDHRNWDRRWRDNHRYDWRNYRTSHRQVYRLGRYYSPYRSWSYRRLSIGFNLDSLFYSNRYWISDPWQYRLPPAYGPYRWVRYYDDALLVDTYSGEVVDVIYDFFW